MYNIFMMEEVHSIFAVGAGAVTKLVDNRPDEDGGTVIKRIFNPKYPYEYLRAYEKRRAEDDDNKVISQILDFYSKH